MLEALGSTHLFDLIIVALRSAQVFKLGAIP